MKPGNLLIQGAKSGGKREMRIRYTHIESVGVRFLFCSGVFCQCANVREMIRKDTVTWKKDFLLPSV